MVTAREALQTLYFGEVDSESEENLDRRFVRTNDFERFLDPRYVLILGAKGSGKSALFEMFAKHIASTRALAGSHLNGVLITTGTGFGDMTELTTADIQSFQELPGFHYDSLWKVYIALKLATELGRLGYTSDGPLRDFLRLTSRTRDYRIGPMIRSAWTLVVGNAPAELEIQVMGSGARIVSSTGTLDVLELLRDIQAVLVRNDRRVWLLFDKIDEIHPNDPDQRDRALEALFPATMWVQRQFPQIIPRVFIRTDLYGPRLSFTNKSHLVGKDFEINWDAKDLRLLMLKRALASEDVREFVAQSVPQLRAQAIESRPESDAIEAFNVIFERRAYPGPREASTLDWMIARATDAKGSTFPRELITYGRVAREKQLEKGGPGEGCLIAGRSVVEAYYDVSKVRCQTYLSEFPDLAEHVKRFRGKHDSPFTRGELDEMFGDLNLCGLGAIERLHEAGVLAAAGRQDVSVAESFEVPRLYRSGLGLSIRARP